MEVDGSDHCTKNPQTGGRIVGGLHILSHPVHALHRLVWIWMGDPALVKVADIPDFSHLSDDTRRHVKEARLDEDGRNRPTGPRVLACFGQFAALPKTTRETK
jgi:vanillate O-demethylase monooxygenase subunit